VIAPRVLDRLEALDDDPTLVDAFTFDRSLERPAERVGADHANEQRRVRGCEGVARPFDEHRKVVEVSRLDDVLRRSRRPVGGGGVAAWRPGEGKDDQRRNHDPRHV
jgi:hypothetical protein